MKKHRFFRKRSGEGTPMTLAIGGQEEFAISNLAVSVQNNALGSGRSEGYTATATVNLEIPVRFLGNVLPPAQMTLHVRATYMPRF